MTALAANSEMFLQLLTTQLKNQSPLDPMDPTEFTNQLATYSALEQQIQTNDTLNSVVSQLSALTSMSALSYLGTTAELASNVGVMQDGMASWNYTLPSDAKSVTLTVTDEAGTVLFTGSGETASGSHALNVTAADLSGLVNEGEALLLTVTALDGSGAALTTETTSLARITTLNGLGSDATYSAGSVAFSGSDIVRLHSKSSN